MRAAFDALGSWLHEPLGPDEAEPDTLLSTSGPHRYRAVFISDLHLGTPGCQAVALLDFLKHHPSDHLYLLGDIVDGWQLRRKWFWPQTHNDVVQKLLRRARKGCRVVFVPGNHDVDRSICRSSMAIANAQSAIAHAQQHRKAGRDRHEPCRHAPEQQAGANRGTEQHGDPGGETELGAVVFSAQFQIAEAADGDIQQQTQDTGDQCQVIPLEVMQDKAGSRFESFGCLLIFKGTE